MSYKVVEAHHDKKGFKVRNSAAQFCCAIRRNSLTRLRTSQVYKVEVTVQPWLAESFVTLSYRQKDLENGHELPVRIVSVDGAWVVEELREEHGPTEVHTVKFELAGVNNSLAPCGDAVVRTGLAGDVLAKAGRGAPDDGAVQSAAHHAHGRGCWMGVFTFWAYGDMRKDISRIGCHLPHDPPPPHTPRPPPPPYPSPPPPPPRPESLVLGSGTASAARFTPGYDGGGAPSFFASPPPPPDGLIDTIRHVRDGSRDRVSGEAATALLVTLLAAALLVAAALVRLGCCAGADARARAAQLLRARLGAAVGRTPVVGARLAVLVGGGYSAQRLAQDDDGDGAGDGEFRAKSKAKTPEAGTPESEGDDDDGGGDDGDAGGGGGAWVDINGGYGGDGDEGEGEDDDDEAESSVMASSSVAALSRVSLAPLD